MGTQQLIEYFHLNIIATLIQNVIGLLSVADNNCFGSICLPMNTINSILNLKFILKHV